MRRHRLRAPGLVAAASLALCAAACGGSAGTSSSAPAAGRPAPFVIGALFSQTGSGATYGPQQVRGAKLAVAHINAAGGIDGVRLRFVNLDDRSEPTGGVAQMEKLIGRERVVAVLGPTLSQVAISADPVADRLQTPVVAVSNAIDHLVGDCPYPCTWIWRASLPERIAVRANVDAYVRAHHPSTAATIVAPDDVLGKAGVDHAVATFRSDGVRVTERFAAPASSSLTGVVRRALATHPDVLFIGAASGAFGAEAIKAARAQGFRGGILGGNSFNSSVTRALAGRAGAGVLSGSAWWSGNDFPANASFITAFEQAYGAEPDQFAAQAYTGVEIVADALRRSHAAHEQTLVARRDAVQRGLGDVAITSVLGPFRFTRQHDVDQIAWILEMDGKGGHELVDFCNPGC